MPKKQGSKFSLSKWYLHIFPANGTLTFQLMHSSATGRLIPPKDHASVQLNVALVDPVTGLYNGESISYCLSGYVRNMSEGNDSIDRLCSESGLLKNVWTSRL